MILSTHFVTGAAVASYTDSPAVLIAGAIILHFLLDLIPHWEYVNRLSELKKRIPYLLIDIVSGPMVIFIAILVLFGFNLENLYWFFLGGLASMLPDSLTFLYIIFPKNNLLKNFYRFHNWVHLLTTGEKQIDWRFGFAFQIMLDVIAVTLIALSKA